MSWKRTETVRVDYELEAVPHNPGPYLTARLEHREAWGGVAAGWGFHVNAEQIGQFNSGGTWERPEDAQREAERALELLRALQRMAMPGRFPSQKVEGA